MHLTDLSHHGGPPAIVVTRGLCIIENCTFTDCTGTGVPSAMDEDPEDAEDGEILPLAVLRNCIISTGNIQHPGVEVRAYGSAILENCEISNCGQGVAACHFPKRVALKNCNIFNNKNEGILVQEEYIYDNKMEIHIENCNIHHNQLGISHEFSKIILIKNSEIHSNRSWGIALRNCTVAFVGGNDISRNECGGVKIMLNRQNHTLITNNRIHHHTGPDIMQTRFYSENQQEQYKSLTGKYALTDHLNREPVLLLDNLSFNNELQYASFEDMKIFSNTHCEMCQGPRGRIKCKVCLYTAYCSMRCLQQHEEAHREFCQYFREQRVIRIELDREDFSPANKTIEDFSGRLTLNSRIYKRDILVKLNNGDNYYGLDQTRQAIVYDRYEPHFASSHFIYYVVKSFFHRKG